MFWKLIYRGKFQREDTLIEASSLEMAGKVGKAYCDKKAYKFIAVMDMVSATEEEYFPKVKAEKAG